MHRRAQDHRGEGAARIESVGIARGNRREPGQKLTIAREKRKDVQRLVERNLNVQPTITVRPGWSAVQPK